MIINDLNTKEIGNPAWVALDDGNGDTYKANFPDVVADAAETAAETALSEADISGNPVTFTSGDAASPTAWASVSTITTGSTLATLFNRVSTMVKNVRYLWKLIGSSSFSNVASTLSGAIGNTALTTTAQTLSGAIAEHESDISTLNGNLDIKTGGVTMKVTGTPHLVIRQSGHVVSIFGWIGGMSISANTSITVAKITGVSLPPDVVRVRGAAGANAYTVGNDAYIGLEAGGDLYLYTTANATTMYFALSYIA